MPTPRAAMAQVAAILADIDPQDREAVSMFYERRLPRYPAPTQAVIADFLIGLTGLPTVGELRKLKEAVVGNDGLAGILRHTIIDLVRRDGPDLSARQLGVFLTCYLDNEAQTVGGLAAKLNVSKPAITRALDRLSEFDLVRRKTDPLDRRTALVQRTPPGMAFLRELRGYLRDAASPKVMPKASSRRAA